MSYFNSIGCMNLKVKKVFAFTLAEVLVALGIIGVVSALTVPTLMRNHQKKVYTVQLHKFYSELSNALESYQNSKNAVNLVEAGLNTNAELSAFVRDSFKVVQTCNGSLTPCLAETYVSLDGKKRAILSTTSYTLASGVAIRPYIEVSGNKLINLMVDTNGAQKPNILGRDLFFFAIYSDGTIDDFYNANTNPPLTEEQRDELYANGCAGTAASNHWGCFNKILNDGWEMTY